MGAGPPGGGADDASRPWTRAPRCAISLRRPTACSSLYLNAASSTRAATAVGYGPNSGTRLGMLARGTRRSGGGRSPTPRDEALGTSRLARRREGIGTPRASCMAVGGALESRASAAGRGETRPRRYGRARFVAARATSRGAGGRPRRRPGRPRGPLEAAREAWGGGGLRGLLELPWLLDLARCCAAAGAARTPPRARRGAETRARRRAALEERRWRSRGRRHGFSARRLRGAARSDRASGASSRSRRGLSNAARRGVFVTRKASVNSQAYRSSTSAREGLRGLGLGGVGISPSVPSVRRVGTGRAAAADRTRAAESSAARRRS